jgi:tetratricopeptide (TPR) repeat protein
MELRTADLMYRKDSIKAIAATILRLCPLSYDLEGNLSHPGWGELLDLAQEKALHPLKKTIEEFSEDKFVTSAPLQKFLAVTASEVPSSTFLAASARALACQHSHPAGAFLLAYLSLMGWIYQQDSVGVYRIESGCPDPGWCIVPYSCASTLATKMAGGYWTARRIVQEARGVLSLSKTAAPIREIDEALGRYQALERMITSSLEYDIDDLAAQIQDACRPVEGNWRPEIGAISWSLGQVPESRMFRPGTEYLPSLQFFKRLVRASITAIPSDALCQYLWLELKDRPPCSLRDHRSLFAIINASYYHLRLEAGPIPMAKAYAMAAIELFKEQADEQIVHLFLDQFHPFSERTEMADTAADMRIAALGIELSRSETEAGRRLRLLFDKNAGEMFAVTMRLAVEMIADSVLYPEWPDTNNFANGFLHEMVERNLSSVGKDMALEALRECVTANEQLRAAAIQYWLMVTLPLPTRDEDAALRGSLDEDMRLRRTLRSAYFLSRWHAFPHHYRFFSVSTREPNILKGFQDQLAVPTDVEMGRDRYRRARMELKEVTKRMAQIAPSYAKKRATDPPSMVRILGFLNAHRPEGVVVHSQEMGSSSSLAPTREDLERAKDLNDKAAHLANMGEFEQAVAVLDQALTLWPTCTHAAYNRGAALLQLKRLDEADAAFDSIITLDPEYADGYFGKGNVCLDSGKYRDAVLYFDRAIEKAFAGEWRKGDYWYNKGLALRKLGLAHDADRCFKNAEQYG